MVGLLLALTAPPAHAEPAIINGEDATAEDWPMAGGLIVQADIGYGFGNLTTKALMCTATLIAPDVVMTAAHCTDLQDFLSFYYGGIEVSHEEYGFSNDGDLSQYFFGSDLDWPDGAGTGKKFVANDKFDLFTMQVGLAKNFDIALIFLDQPLLDAPIAWLPSADEAEQIATGNPVEIVGYGQTDADDPYSTGNRQMADSVIADLAPYEMQIGAKPSDGRKCHGDSGGPTFMQVDSDTWSKWRVIGITSHSYDLTDCASEGGVDTRVDFYLDWIDEQMRAACDDGTRSWCDEPGILTPPSTEAELPWVIGLTSRDSHGMCSTSGGEASVWLAGAGLLALRRRKKPA